MNSITDSAAVMPDVQSSADTRRMPIQRVGVRGVRHPMLVSGAGGQPMPTVADWELTVALPAHEKGTHMSRFVALLERYRATPMTPALFCEMAQNMLPLLNAEKGDIRARFPYFIEKVAPVSQVASLMDYEVSWKAIATADDVQFELSVLVPVTSLCPCSKAISQYGAHNQRSHVTVEAVFDTVDAIDVNALIQGIEQQASCELWGLLKRGDEKFVTERAYENPKFVEDLVRDVAVQLQSINGVQRFRVEAENFESIHNHSAYAVVEG
ncbi:GTP cyclohydrolase FolE2 [Neopusillimonas aromaticivorans]|jgi:GTP cyclohydrolase IB|uniref:GTP cyclohydrolase FolE2 n=1 Tax=Neopusillimonas aromaticivorans TaxID=2979868 RepID=UPI002597411C|nr:GTP cyclohydrolase FolE2 [Neopusillimonas aromaticivorans]NLZ10013.1 GTP cyclohydrolase I FolE2 [Alcaligenaceae bacterium]WJJ93918.1 GTP cyclohydrolase FolE2 [Neopusillimonas aromaticivorans]